MIRKDSLPGTLPRAGEGILLPEPFAGLQPFAAGWALPGMSARRQKRLQSSAAERDAFYAAMSPRITAVMDYLSAVPLRELSDSQKSLLQLALCLAEISLSIEVYNAEVEAKHAPSSRLVDVQREMDGL